MVTKRVTKYGQNVLIGDIIQLPEGSKGNLVLATENENYQTEDSNEGKTGGTCILFQPTPRGAAPPVGGMKGACTDIPYRTISLHGGGDRHGGP